LWLKCISQIIGKQIANFNTSYVLVQENKILERQAQATFQYIICFGSRALYFFCHTSIILFQYIICFGSRCCNLT